MITFLYRNYQALLLFAFWIAAGIFNEIAGYAAIIISAMVLRSKNLHTELLMGFIVILILDDNIHNQLFSFTTSGKMIYILVLSLIFFLNYSDFTPVFRLFLWFVPFLVSALISLVIFSPVIFEGFQKTISYFLILLVIPNYVVMVFREKGFRVFKDLFYFSLLIIISGYIILLVNPEFVYVKGRFSGVFGNPNGLGIYCTLAFLLYIIVNEFKPDLFDRSDKIWFYLFVVTSLFMTASRTTYLALVVFYLFTFFHRVSPLLSFTLLLGILIGYELLFDFLLDMIIAMDLGSYFRLQTLQEGAGRIVAWNFAWDEIQSNFFLGRGFHYDVAYFRTYYPVLQKMGHEGLVHNSYLSLWLNTGIIGLILFLIPYFILFLGNLSRSIYSVPVFYAIIVSSFFESWLVASLNPFLVYFLFILTLFNSKDIHERKTQDIIPVH